MNRDNIRFARGETERKLWSVPLDGKPAKKNLDKIQGCLIGGAAGDALGYVIEFLTEDTIFRNLGKPGLTEYRFRNGLARISDDTQMTMFTATGLLSAAAREGAAADIETYGRYIARTYRDWYKTQCESFDACNRKFITSWLMHVPEIFASRAPGRTCLSAIYSGCGGSVEFPLNNSKGCGGVMRVAPIGLFFADLDVAPLGVDLLGADAAALTHGHEMGYIPGAMLVHIVRLVANSDDITLKDAVLSAMGMARVLFPDAETLPGFLELISRAVELSESDVDHLSAIHQLGAGWIGDEALAIAIYCALKYADDFDMALIASVNHNGDSDSTGAITGNILGAYLGLSRIPQKYLDKLELKAELLELAEDLYRGIPDGTDAAYERAWREKYVDITYRAENHD